MNFIEGPGRSTMEPSRHDVSLESAALARRLREMREATWPDVTITQSTLARALGGVAVSTISAWENPNSTNAPPRRRLAAYATFFATRRSLDGEKPRVLHEDELTEAERAERDRLLDELQSLRGPAAPVRAAIDSSEASRGTWHFPDGAPVRLICGRPPDDIQRKIEHPWADPSSPNYVELLAYADTDALVELFGHIRASNPTSDVRFLLHHEVQPDDLSDHVVLLGGLSITDSATWFSWMDFPVSQDTTPDPNIPGGDVFVLDATKKRFEPKYVRLGDDLRLVEDVGLIARMPNPVNSARTLTVCNGVCGRGVLGAVRCLTDQKLRTRNERYLAERFDDSAEFGLLVRVPVLGGNTLTPDLHRAGTVLYEWSSPKRT
jgi:transcriptional regulator with XRE-family HTH domain